MIKYLRNLYLHKMISKHQHFYNRTYSYQESLNIQLELFNRNWKIIKNNVQYYKIISSKLKLPEEFKSWEEIIEAFPIINRTFVQDNMHLLTNKSKSPQWYRTTGGSTAQPIQMPAWISEKRYASADLWAARYWYGINPSDRLFLIWGQSHIFKPGLRGFINRWLRELKDCFLGYYRFSAYNINEESMRKAGEDLIKFRPNYIVGYSRVLDLFSRANEDRAAEFKKLKIKAVIAAAECFPFSDSVERIKALFEAPVGMEYGSAETNLLAHTNPKGGYQVFWKSYFLEAHGDNNTVLVTSLYPRCFPLIRYELGDEIELFPNSGSFGIKEFLRVKGRCNDYLILCDGSKIHSELITHALMGLKEIKGYQAIQNGKGIELHLISSIRLSNKIIQSVMHSLIKINPCFKYITIKQVEKLKQTNAGKTPMVIRIQ